jgi:hypothetical protein
VTFNPLLSDIQHPDCTEAAGVFFCPLGSRSAVLADGPAGIFHGLKTPRLPSGRQRITPTGDDSGSSPGCQTLTIAQAIALTGLPPGPDSWEQSQFPEWRVELA